MVQFSNPNIPCLISLQKANITRNLDYSVYARMIQWLSVKSAINTMNATCIK